ncbi:hypothetical protein [Roseobacter sp. HKCCA0434]|uniref:hypothetical protein n=1 Tax=Roseobacter sp. HKCCA0434 TaxID=3079297 RepID=UPI002905E312|nr:hypothetical protein [Roseobacter sp. HKCCA0434]
MTFPDRTNARHASGAVALALTLSPLGPFDATRSQAETFTIDGFETETNGGEVLDGGDTLFVTPTGEIQIMDANSAAVRATGRRTR